MSYRSIAFEYRSRRGGATGFAPALAGSTIELEEQVEYLLSFKCELSAAEKHRLLDLGGEFLFDNTAVLGFGNFIGRTTLAGVEISVVSSKVGPGGASRILQEVSNLASSLVFGWRSPISFEGTLDYRLRSPVPYHQLQLVRHSMLEIDPGQRLQDWIATIERNPTRRFEPERPVADPTRVRRLDHRAIRSIFSRLDRLVPVPSGATLAAGLLARSLTFGSPPRPHFPAKLESPRGRLSFDTPENRFVKHVVAECLALVYRFVDHPKLHAGLKSDCRTMLGILERQSASAFMADAGRLSAFTGPTQALAKAEGYRDIFAFWGDMSRCVSLPPTKGETNRFLEGRDMATLYEYWVFLTLLAAVVAVTGSTPAERVALHRDELGESLAVGLVTKLGTNIVVRFNPGFTRKAGTCYSTPLRPDITLQAASDLFAFDAKYRLVRFDVAEDDSDDAEATYKRADLYKMHTYRDAISGLRAAFVVYPGTEFVFFERSGMKRVAPEPVFNPDGVGAVPLRPADADPAQSLRTLLRVLLSPYLPPPTA